MPSEVSIPLPSTIAKDSLKWKYENPLPKWRRKVCTRKFLHKRLPILTWIPKYDLNTFVSDLVAGITCGLMAIPQAIAYAAVAGLPLQYGLYTSFLPPFFYIFLGTSKETFIGTTAINALLTFSYTGGRVEYAIFLAFLSGCVELLAGILNLGFLVGFISAPVTSGFISAAAITVTSTQLKGLFGLKFEGSTFIGFWSGLFNNLQNTRPADAGLGFSCIVFLLLLRKLNLLADLSCVKRLFGTRIAWFRKFLWFVANSRNVLVVLGGCTATYFLKQNGYEPFSLTGNIKSGLPQFDWPHFTINKMTGNVTKTIGFGEICKEIGTGVGLMPFLSILQHIAIVKGFAHGRKTDATQEILTLGLSSIVSSFFGAMPITGSFGLSSILASSGVQTPMANVYVGGVLLLALAFLMPFFSYIAKPTLSAVIITSVIFLVDYEEIKPMWKSRRVELIPFAITLLCCLFVSMEYGILIGTGFHLLLFTYLSNKTKPKVLHLHDHEVAGEEIIIKVDSGLYFPGVDNFRRALNKAVLSSVSAKTGTPNASIILDLGNVPQIDYTALKMMQSIAGDLRKQNVVLHFLNANRDVQKSLRAALPAKDIAFLPKEGTSESTS